DMLRADGLPLIEKKTWKAEIDGPPRFSRMTAKERKAAILRDPAYGKIVCRCESVTEAEVLYAIRHGARTLDGVKFRVRAGMGRCQGGFCTTRIMDILSQTLGIPLAEISKRGPGSEVCVPRHDNPSAGGEQ
ncbi:MAG: (2Fe-2S)-binding protein, partial [Desulfuromusa sp.]|nr:(2Fe-2S)-binding protein [Desulfuromusa sp.]